MKRFFTRRAGALSLAFLSVLSLVSFFTPFLVSNVSAASSWDTVINTTTTLTLKSPPGWGSDPDIDVTATAHQYFDGTLTTGVGYNPMTSGQKAAFASAYASGFYALIQINNYGGTGRCVTAVWDSTSDFLNKVEFQSSGGTYYAQINALMGVGGTGTDKGAVTMCVYGTTKEMAFYPSSIATQALYGTTSALADYEIYMSTFPVVYPPGYAGVLIPSPVPPAVQISPTLIYSVDDLDINAIWTSQQDIGSTCPGGSSDRPFIVDCDELTNDTPIFTTDSGDKIPVSIKYEMISDGVVVDTQYVGFFGQYIYRVPAIGTYHLTQTYVDDVTHDELPDDTQYIFNISDVEILFDGSTYSVPNSGLDCSVVDGVNVCEQYVPYEVCEIVPSANIVDWANQTGDFFACQAGNFQTWMRSTLVVLFVPNFGFWNTYSSSMQSFITTKLGFVYQSIAFIVGFFGEIVTSGASTSCTISPPGTFYGQSVTFDVCTFEDIFPSGFTLIQTLLIALTVISLFFAGLRKYHEVLQR